MKDYYLLRSSFALTVLFTGAPHLTYGQHVELHLLLHSDMRLILRQEEGSLDCAAVRPRVIEGDIMDVNGSWLNVAVLGPLPLEAVAEIFVEDLASGVVIVENLREGGTQEIKRNFWIFFKSWQGMKSMDTFF